MDAPIGRGNPQLLLSQPAHALSWQDVVQELGSHHEDGLEHAEAAERLASVGANELDDDTGVDIVAILVSQVANAMTLVLILAMSVSFGIGAYIEGGVVALVIALNIAVGMWQDMSGQRVVANLRTLSAPTASVVRSGDVAVVPSRELVPGDVIEVKMGDTFPADVRLIETVNLETDEKNLTGEAMPVRKKASETHPATTGPGDRLNMAYSSTGVTKGRARGVVFATGTATEMGLVAAELKKGREKSTGHIKSSHHLREMRMVLISTAGRLLGLNTGTALQRRLARLAMVLFFVAVVCAIVVLAVNGFSSRREVVIYAVATGLSMMPASLVAVLAITMTDGTRRMVARHVAVRRAAALEALGSVTDICTDKTGTLTVGEMVARAAWVPGWGTVTVRQGVEDQSKNQAQDRKQALLDPEVGEVWFESRQPRDVAKEGPEDDKEVDGNNEPNDTPMSATGRLEAARSVIPLTRFLDVASLASLAHVTFKDGAWHACGDPTEVAIQVLAGRFGRRREDANIQVDVPDVPDSPDTPNTPEWAMMTELPFDSDVKLMSVVVKQRSTDTTWILTKGAVERILERCILSSDTPHDDIFANARSLAGLGLRVLALASRPINIDPQDINPDNRASLEKDLVFRGLVGLYDPPRPESRPAVQECHAAGICVRMLTGDHLDTARAIAVQVGILPSSHDPSLSTTAAQLDALSDSQLDALPALPLVVARCAPATKVRIVAALHRRGSLAAMTGDGVNDAPALMRADVGINMGRAGSQVTRDASDLVLLDDNFRSIVDAVREGRRLLANIQRFVLHVLAANVAQACVLLVGLVFRDENALSVFPLAPVQIVWIIMATSALPDMGLGFERAAPDVMTGRPPSRGGAIAIFTPEFLADVAVYGVWIAALCLASFVLVVFAWGDGDLGQLCNEAYSTRCELVFRARATTFACLTCLILFLAWEIVHPRRSFFVQQGDSGHEHRGQKHQGPEHQGLKSWFADVYANRFLFWSIVCGLVTIFPVMYIPVLSTSVFKHAAISWEWAIVAIIFVIFFAGVEAWKAAKRWFFGRGKVGRDLEAAEAGDVEKK